MSTWGLKDNVTISGNVTTANTSPIVSGFGESQFLIDVLDGDYITIAANKYQVKNVTSNTSLTLTANAATNSANVKAYVQQGPKYIGNVDIAENVYTIQRIYGVDVNEAVIEESRAINIKTPGWVHYQTYSSNSGTRHKAEVLVALSKNFTAAAAGDAADDSLLLDYLLYFSTQPSDRENVVANASTTFSVVATSEPSGATLTYQWQSSPNNVVFANLSDAGVYSGTDSNTLTISNVAGLDGTYFKVVISNDVATSNTSDAAILTLL